MKAPAVAARRRLLIWGISSGCNHGVSLVLEAGPNEARWSTFESQPGWGGRQQRPGDSGEAQSRGTPARLGLMAVLDNAGVTRCRCHVPGAACWATCLIVAEMWTLRLMWRPQRGTVGGFYGCMLLRAPLTGTGQAGAVYEALRVALGFYVDRY